MFIEISTYRTACTFSSSILWLLGFLKAISGLVSVSLGFNGAMISVIACGSTDISICGSNASCWDSVLGSCFLNGSSSEGIGNTPGSFGLTDESSECFGS